MGWMLPVGLAAFSYLAGEERNKQIAKQNEANQMAAAAQTQFSPYTGMGAGKAQIRQEGNSMGDALQGALMGMSFQDSGEKDASKGENLALNTATEAPQSTANETSWEDMLRKRRMNMEDPSNSGRMLRS